jgi:AcrR family transcriptional regulator
MAASASRPLRRDAQANRDRLVTAARALLARQGVDVSVEEITRRAGVGMGTLYRHFPSKEDLVDAVLEDAFAELVAVAEASAGEPDAWTGLCRFVEHALDLNARNRGLKDVVESRGHGRQRAERMRRRIRPLVERMVERAQEQGMLRPDFTALDLSLVFWGADRVIELGSEVAPDLWRRHLAIMLDGLRATAATAPLPGPPPTRGQVERVLRAKPGRAPIE